MKAFKTILASILSIVLVLSLFTVIIIINVSSFFTEDNMEKTVKKIDITHEISKIQNSSATSYEKSEIADIIDTAYKEAEDHGISSKLVDTIFNSNEVKTFLGKIVGKTTDTLVNGKGASKVTSEDFNKLLDDNIDKWIIDSGVDISESKKEVLLIRMKNAGAGAINNLPDSEVITDKVGFENLNIIQTIFSNKIKIGLIVLTIICLVLLILLKKKESLLYSGTSLLLSGFVLIGISFIITDIITLLLTEYNLSFMISAFNNSLSKNIMISGILSVIISIIMFIVYKKVNR